MDSTSFNAFDVLSAGSASATGISVSQVSSLQVTAVMRCVSILSMSMVKLIPKHYRVEGNGEREEIKGSKLVRVLRKPNPITTWSDFMMQMQAALSMRGNAWAVPIYNVGGEIVKLYPVNPDKVGIWEAPDGRLFCCINKSSMYDNAFLEGKPILIPYEEMLHVKSISGNGILGVSKIAVAKEAVALALSQEQQTARYTGRNAQPSGVLTTDKAVDAAARKKIEQSWRENYGGLRNTGRIVVLEQGLKWDRVTLNAVDADFLRQRRFQVEEIARLFDIPPYKLFDVESAAKTNSQGMAQLEQEFINDTILPYAVMWEQKLNDLFGLDVEEEYIELDFGKAHRADLKTRYDAYRVAILSGFMSPQEVRLSEGMRAEPEFGNLFTPSNMAGPGSDVSGQPADGAGRPPQSQEDAAK